MELKFENLKLECMDFQHQRFVWIIFMVTLVIPNELWYVRYKRS
jgi:hypothetical protein